MTTYSQESDNSNVALEELKGEQDKMRDAADRKRLESLWWAAVLIWAGAVFAADYLAILPQFREESPWSWIFLGAGLFGLAGALIRTANVQLPKPTGWDYFWSALFLIVGATGFFGGGITFPILLVVIGAATVANQLFRHN